MFKAFTYEGNNVQKLKNVVITNPCIIWIVCGVKNISVDGYKYTLKKDEAIFLSGNSKISFENFTEDGFFISKQITFIRKPNIESVRKNKFELSKYRSVKLDSQLKMTMEFLHQADSILNNIKTRSMWLDGLYLLLLDYDYLEMLFRPDEISFNEKVYEILDKMDPKEHRIESICLVLNISKATLIRRLKKSGTQFKKIVRQVRMNKALFLIQKRTIPLDEISFSCGYQSMELFNLYFESEFGISPKNYIKTFSGI
ncbi:transcriptional regulator, AraC family [Aliivibrio fischeri ES114]|uniref:Transcriptional regulator, AraC family n=1 Tax=Aliivibrio fischeri (strain ATCC 700601 / ES114) TaxID=312309 RepID=Q5E051_ALIF1|nr:helix-turn-helix transcriptional regulator [Aliivibrio fischeri]AAW87595.1 transcriptional regulator, AraC family [Aliivibrio fischeri ES114]KLU78244.1 AraC family transcriptional regulator [Aliivibrio fischeri]MUK27373.1 helix-turn-helix domain-containing protein [Aliivibrio fischeri]MUK35222.1 helix-turn-helix domain-containing protein [Aliivibrio fischeri]